MARLVGTDDVRAQDDEDAPVRERAILVGVELDSSEWPLESSLDELARLADTAGLDVVASVSQRLESQNPRTFVGRGKVDEIASLIRSLSADVVVFDDELSPSQQSNLETCFSHNARVIDRTSLILEIFAQHATSREGRLQVQLAHYQYLYPRLRGMWAHLESNRMGGGVGSRFGEGESQLEVDRRIVRNRIVNIERTLAHLREVRSLQRSRRYASGVYKIALAGYTNAGKSSLLNRLCDSNVLCYDKLFATLDSATRKLTLPDGRLATITDTVGFIHKLPHGLVEAFKSTLDEICGADLILHVVDASSPEHDAQMQTVRETLEEIGARDVACIEVFNKADLLDDDERASLARRYPNAHMVSAETGENLDALVGDISFAASADDVHMDVVIPYDAGKLVSIAHEKCHVVATSYEDGGTRLSMLVSPELASTFEPYRA